MKYYGMFKINQDYSLDVKYVTTDRNMFVDKFTSAINERAKDVKVEDEGYKFAIFEDGVELWAAETKGEECEGDYVYVVFGEINTIVLDGVYCSREAAVAHLDEIVKEYEDHQISLDKRYEDLIILENDDYFKIQKIKLTKGDDVEKIFMITKIVVEESVKNSEVMVVTFESEEEAVERFNSEVELMREDVEEHGGQINVSEKDAWYDNDEAGIYSHIQLRTTAVGKTDWFGF